MIVLLNLTTKIAVANVGCRTKTLLTPFGGEIITFEGSLLSVETSVET